jgi:predicted RNase H-like HicB family nuclease
MRTMEYGVIYAKTGTGYSAHAPDLPGCIATGRTLALTRRRMREALALHLKGMREDGIRIPRPTTLTEQVDVGEGVV